MSEQRQRPLFVMEQLRYMGRRLDWHSGSGKFWIDDDRLRVIVERKFERFRERLAGAKTRDSRLNESILNRADDDIEYETRPIANAHVFLFLYVLLEYLDEGVFRHFIYEVKHGRPRRDQPQIPVEVLDFYFASARRELGIRKGRRKEVDPWVVLGEYDALRDELESTGVRNPGEEACIRMAEEHGIALESMQQRIKRARAAVRRLHPEQLETARDRKRRMATKKPQI